MAQDPQIPMKRQRRNSDCPSLLQEKRAELSQRYGLEADDPYVAQIVEKHKTKAVEKIAKIVESQDCSPSRHILDRKDTAKSYLNKILSGRDAHWLSDQFNLDREVMKTVKLTVEQSTQIEVYFPFHCSVM